MTSSRITAALLYAYTVTLATSTTADDPNWGCGLLGPLPGINADGSTEADTQRLIDGIKGASTYAKPTFWNWDLAPKSTGPDAQHLSKDFIFMPEQWGAGVVKADALQQGGVAGVKDVGGNPTPATMADILLGSNEPDVLGFCMGNMFGTCNGSCTNDEASAGPEACPVAHLTGGAPDKANAVGHCNCWQFSHATGVGFWSFEGCYDPQPLPNMWNDTVCTTAVMNAWKVTASIAAKKGYRFLSTPLVATNMAWLRNFVKHACDGCSDVSCGCPTHVAFHFYANDCRPTELGGYADFQRKLNASAAIMEEFPNIKGAIINEVGMLNGGCGSQPCKYPADTQPGHTCPSNPDLPNGLGGFLETLLDKVSKATTKDGRKVVKGFSWFNQPYGTGGAYDLRLIGDDSKVNSIGESYIKGCQAWAASIAANSMVYT